MTTPTRSEIIEKAFEIHQQRNYNVSCNSPTIEEVKENGIWEEARDSLMRNDNSYVTYIEQEARSLGLMDHKIEVGKQRKPSSFEIDFEECLRSGVFIAGGKGATKSNLAKIIVDKLMKLGYTVKVFDISKSWLKSSVPYFNEIEMLHETSGNLYQSIVFDLSKLMPKDAKRFVAKVLTEEWNKQVNIPEHQRKWIVYVFEECQMLVPQGHLRSNKAQQILRLMTSGRNFQLGFIAITQRPALTDTSVFELTFQRYFSRMDGENDIKKVANYIGYEKASELENLRLGEFFYDKGSKTKWIHTREFKTEKKTMKLEIPQSLPEPQMIKKPQHHQNENSLVPLLIALMWFAAIILALIQRGV